MNLFVLPLRPNAARRRFPTAVVNRLNSQSHMARKESCPHNRLRQTGAVSKRSRRMARQQMCARRTHAICVQRKRVSAVFGCDDCHRKLEKHASLTPIVLPTYREHPQLPSMREGGKNGRFAKCVFTMRSHWQRKDRSGDTRHRRRYCTFAAKAKCTRQRKRPALATSSADDRVA